MTVPPRFIEADYGSSPLKSRTRFPETLDFKSHPQAAVVFFRDLRKYIVTHPVPQLVLDTSDLRFASPSAALVLFSELLRSQRVITAGQKTQLTAKRAPNAEVNALLGEVGFWRYFPGIDWHAQHSSRTYLKLVEGANADGAVADKFIREFQEEAHLKVEDEAALYAAIMEIMQNVPQHAYTLPIRVPHLGGWWMLGWRDTQSHEISFCMFDQGAGIPRTIRTRPSEWFNYPLIGTSDEELIVKAVEEGHSRTQDATRGTGFPALKKLIDDHDGELLIVSDRSHCIFNHNGRPRLRRLPVSVGGTLISWTLKSKHEPHDKADKLHDNARRPL